MTMHVCRTNIVLAKNWIKYFPWKNLVKSRGKSGMITYCPTEKHQIRHLQITTVNVGRAGKHQTRRAPQGWTWRALKPCQLCCPAPCYATERGSRAGRQVKVTGRGNSTGQQQGGTAVLGCRAGRQGWAG